jgi:uncharacterized protein YigE (DUF2233 family)
MKFPAVLFALVLLSTATGYPLDCVTGEDFTVCRVNLGADNLQLFLRDDAGKPLKSFDAVEQLAATRNQKLLFAMNAGMYQVNLSPLGLFVSAGKQISPLNLKNSSWGNFYLKPNGVFYINEKGAGILESSRYPAISSGVRLATQSGPMLVIDGKIHPVFQQDSTSRLFRNGVGIVSPKEVVFLISEKPVNFHEFASYFRDVLHCKNALFFDGTVSSLYSRELNRNDHRIDLGPIIGVVQ